MNIISNITNNIKRLILSNTIATCTACVIDDIFQGVRLKLGFHKKKTGTTHAKLSINESIEYIETVYKNFLKWGDINHFHGTVAEIGPGDNFGVAIMILKQGADHVYAIDRFYSWRDTDKQKSIYEELARKYGFNITLDDNENIENNINGLTYQFGTPAETYFSDNGKLYDAIVSCAVLEHLYDPFKALDHMYSSLKPGGIMVHSIDLRDHGMFPGRPPLTFLSIPENIYKLMSRNTGRPNRALFADYKSWLDKTKAKYSLKITCIHGNDHNYGAINWEEVPEKDREDSMNLIRPFIHKLSKRYSSMSLEDLAVSACVLYLKKDKIENNQ